MLGIPRRHSHFVFGAIQSGLTSMIASGSQAFCCWQSAISSATGSPPGLSPGALMLPLVLIAAPAIRSLSLALTRVVGGNV
jgi:hypothetical protein